MATKQVTGNCTVTVSTSYTGYTVSIPNNWRWESDGESGGAICYNGGSVTCGPYTITSLSYGDINGTSYSVGVSGNYAGKTCVITTARGETLSATFTSQYIASLGRYGSGCGWWTGNNTDRILTVTIK